MSTLQLRCAGLRLSYDALECLLWGPGEEAGAQVLSFEQALIDRRSGQVAIDGHVIGTRFWEGDLADKGYKFAKLGEEQANLLMALDVNTAIPFMSRFYEGGCLRGGHPHYPAYRVAHPYQPFSDRPPSLSSNTPRAFARGRDTRLSGEGRPAAPFRAIYKVRESAGTSLSKPQSSKKSPRGWLSHCNGVRDHVEQLQLPLQVAPVEPRMRAEEALQQEACSVQRAQRVEVIRDPLQKLGHCSFRSTAPGPPCRGEASIPSRCAHRTWRTSWPCWSCRSPRGGR
jgi:hypothetical protein